MKLTRYLWLIFVIALYTLNYFWLKIGMWEFTGIVLLLLIILIVGINVFVKIKNRKKKDSDDFIFPSAVANTMRTIDISIQYESSLLALFALMFGMLLFVIYVIFLAPYNIITKVFIVFNSICGMVLMGSMLITNYQQYMSHRESRQMLTDMANQFGTEILTPDKITPGKMLSPLEAYGFPPREIKEVKDDDDMKKIWDKFRDDNDNKEKGGQID